MRWGCMTDPLGSSAARVPAPSIPWPLRTHHYIYQSHTHNLSYDKPLDVQKLEKRFAHHERDEFACTPVNSYTHYTRWNIPTITRIHTLTHTRTLMYKYPRYALATTHAMNMYA